MACQVKRNGATGEITAVFHPDGSNAMTLLDNIQKQYGFNKEEALTNLLRLYSRSFVNYAASKTIDMSEIDDFELLMEGLDIDTLYTQTTLLKEIRNYRSISRKVDKGEGTLEEILNIIPDAPVEYRNHITELYKSNTLENKLLAKDILVSLSPALELAYEYREKVKEILAHKESKFNNFDGYAAAWVDTVASAVYKKETLDNTSSNFLDSFIKNDPTNFDIDDTLDDNTLDFDANLVFENPHKYQEAIKAKAIGLSDKEAVEIAKNSKPTKHPINSSLNDLRRIQEAKRNINLLTGNKVDVQVGFNEALKTIGYEGIPGNFFIDKVIALNDVSNAGVEFHETFHYIFRSLLTDAQIDHYLGQARNELTQEYINTEKKALLKKYPFYSKLTNKELEDLVLEEYMADKYQEYAKSNTIPTNWLASLYGLIKNVIDFVLGNRTSIEALFGRINNRGFAFNKTKSNKFTMTQQLPVFKTLKIKDDISPAGDPIDVPVDESRGNAIIRRLAGLLYERIEAQTKDGETLEKGEAYEMFMDTMAKESEYYGDISNFLDYYKSLNGDKLKQDAFKGQLKEMETLYDPETTTAGGETNNGEIAWEETKKLFRIFSDQKLSKPLEQEVDRHEEDAAETLEMLDKSAWELNPVEIRDQELKKFMSFILYDTKDAFGNSTREAIDPNVVFDGLLKHTVGRELDGKALFDIIRNYAKDNEQTSAFYNRLIKDTKNDPNSNLANLIRKRLDNMKMDALMVLMDPNTHYIDIFDAANVDDVKTQLETWQGNWQGHRINDVYDQYLKGDPKTINDVNSSFSVLKAFFKGDATHIHNIEETIETIVNGKEFPGHKQLSLFELTGMKLSRGYVRYSLRRAYHEAVVGKPATKTEPAVLPNPNISPLTEIIGADNFAAFENDLAEFEIEGLNGTMLQLLQDTLLVKVGKLPSEVDYIATELGLEDYNSIHEDTAEVKQNDKVVFTGGVMSKMKELSRGNTKFDETLMNTSYQDAAGNDRFGFIKKSYQLVFAKRLTDPTKRAELLEDYPHLVNNVLMNPEFFSPEMLNSIFASKNFKAKLVGDARQKDIAVATDMDGNRDKNTFKKGNTENGEGVTSKNIDFAAFEMVKLAMFAKRKPITVKIGEGASKTIYTSNFYPSVNETKKTDLVVPLPVGGINALSGNIDSYINDDGSYSDAGLRAVYQIFMNELDQVSRGEQEIIKGLEQYNEFYSDTNNYINGKRRAELHKELVNTQARIRAISLMDNSKIKASEVTKLHDEQAALAIRMDEINKELEITNFPDTLLYEGLHVRTDENGILKQRVNNTTKKFEGYEFGRMKDLWNFKSLLDYSPTLKKYMADRSNWLTLKVIQIEGRIQPDGTKSTVLSERETKMFVELDAKYGQGQVPISPLFAEELKQALDEYLTDQRNDYAKLLHKYGVVTLNEDGSILSNNDTHKLPILPYHRDAKGKVVSQYEGNNANDKFLSDFFINHYINVSSYNELTDKNSAIAKDPVDRVKRNGGKVGFGDGNGTGTSTFAYFKEIETRTKFGTEIERADGQSYLSLNGYRNMLKAWGRSPESIQDLLDKIEYGIDNVSWAETEMMNKKNFILNSQKTMLYDGEVYHKLSYAILTRQYTSILPSKNRKQARVLRDRIEMAKAKLKGEWTVPSFNSDEKKSLTNREPDTFEAALTRMDDIATAKLITELKNEFEYLWWPNPMHIELHNLRRNMLVNNITAVLPQSASKLRTPIAAKNVDNHYDFTYSQEELSNEFWKLQMETPSGKQKITTPSQVMNLIDNEMNMFIGSYEIRGEEFEMQEVKDQFHDLVGRRLENAMNMAMRELGQIDSSGNLEVLDMEKFRTKLYETLQSSGADDSLLNFFRESIKNGKELKYDGNLPAIANKFQELFLAHFKKGVLQGKDPGRKITIISDWGNEPVVNLATDEIIPRELLIKNPESYMNEDGSYKDGYGRRPLKWSMGYALDTKIEIEVQGETISEETSITRAEIDQWLLDDGKPTTALEYILKKRGISKKMANAYSAMSDDIAVLLWQETMDYMAAMENNRMDLLRAGYDSTKVEDINEDNWKLYESSFQKRMGYDVYDRLTAGFIANKLATTTPGSLIHDSYFEKDEDGKVTNVEIEHLANYVQLRNFLNLVKDNVIGAPQDQTLAEVLITPWDEFTHGLSVGEEVDRDHPAYKSIMKQFGTRIPTQDLHSMLVFKVAGFLPSYMGDVGVLPMETVWLSGEDFDIDAKYLKRKSYWLDGKSNDVNSIRIHGELAESQKDYWESKYKTFVDRHNAALEAGKFEGEPLDYEYGYGEKKYHYDNFVEFTKKHNNSVQYDWFKLKKDNSELQDIAKDLLELRKQGMVNDKIDRELDTLADTFFNTEEEVDELSQDWAFHKFHSTVLALAVKDLEKQAHKERATIRNADKADKSKLQEAYDKADWPAQIAAKKAELKELKADTDILYATKAAKVKTLWALRNLKKLKFNQRQWDSQTKKKALNKRKKTLERQLFTEALRINDLPTSFLTYDEGLVNGKPNADSMMNNLSINNWILDMINAMYLNKGSVKITYTPASMTKIQGDGTKRGFPGIAKLLNFFTKEDATNYDYNTLTGQMTAKVANKTGDALIGPAAIANIVKAALAKSGVALNWPKNGIPTIEFDGKVYSTMTEYTSHDVEFSYTYKGDKLNSVSLNKIGEEVQTKADRIMDELSTILSAMTDNAKHNDAAKLGYTLDNLGGYLYMISLGMGLNRTSLMSKSPAMGLYNQIQASKKGAFQNYSDYQNAQRSTVSQVEKRLEDQMAAVEQLIKEKLEAADKAGSKTDILIKGKTFDLSDSKAFFESYSKFHAQDHIQIDSEQMLEDIRIASDLKDKYDRDYLDKDFGAVLRKEPFNLQELADIYMSMQSQGNTLRAYSRMSGQGRLFQSVAAVLRIQQGLKPNFYEQQAIYDTLDKFGIDLKALASGSNTFTVPEYDNLIDKFKIPFELVPVINASTDLKKSLKAFHQIMEASKFLFIEQSDVMTNLFDTVKENLGSHLQDRAKIMKGIKGQMMGFITIRSIQQKYRNEGKPSPFDDSMVYSQSGNTIFDRLKKISKIAKDNNDSTLADNLFIRALRRAENKIKEGDFNDYINMSESNKVVTEALNVAVDELTVNTRTKNTAEYNNRVINAYKELMYKQITDNEGNAIMDKKRPDTPVVAAFAKDLFDYLIIKDGLQYKNGSFLKYIAPEMYLEMSDLLKDMTKAFRENQWDTTESMKGLEDLLGMDQIELKDQFVKMYGLNPTNNDLFKKVEMSRTNTDNQGISTINSDLSELIGQEVKVFKKYKLDTDENGKASHRFLSDHDTTLPDLVEFDISQLDKRQTTATNVFITQVLAGTKQLPENLDAEILKFFKIDGRTKFYSEYKKDYPSSKYTNEEQYIAESDKAWGAIRMSLVSKTSLKKKGANLIDLYTNGNIQVDKQVLTLPKFISLTSTYRGAPKGEDDNIILGTESTNERGELKQDQHLYMLINVDAAPTTEEGVLEYDEKTLMKRERGVYVKVDPIYTSLYSYLYNATEFQEVLLKNVRLKELAISRGSLSGNDKDTALDKIKQLRTAIANQKFAFDLYEGSFDVEKSTSTAPLSDLDKMQRIFTNKIGIVKPKIMSYDEFQQVDPISDPLAKHDVLLFKEQLNNVMRTYSSNSPINQKFIAAEESVEGKLKAGQSGIFQMGGKQFILQNLGLTSLEDLLSKLQSKSKHKDREGLEANKVGLDLLEEFFPVDQIESQNLEDFLTYDPETRRLDVNASTPRVIYLVEEYKHASHIPPRRRKYFGMHSIALSTKDNQSLLDYTANLEHVGYQNTNEDTVIKDNDTIISFDKDIVDKIPSDKTYFNITKMDNESLNKVRKHFMVNGIKNLGIVTDGDGDYGNFLREMMKTGTKPESMPTKKFIDSYPTVTSLSRLLFTMGYKATPEEILSTGKINVPLNDIDDKVREIVINKYNALVTEINDYRFNLNKEEMQARLTSEEPKDIARKYPIAQNFYDGKIINGFTYKTNTPGLTSIEMIQLEERTQTTRSKGEQERINDIAIKQGKVGSIVGTILYMQDMGHSTTAGRGVYVEVTSDWIDATDPTFEQTFLDKQGWDPEVLDANIAKFKNGKYKSFDFKFLNTDIMGNAIHHGNVYRGDLDLKALGPKQDVIFGTNVEGSHGYGMAGKLHVGKSDNRADKYKQVKNTPVGLRTVLKQARGHMKGQVGYSYGIQTIKKIWNKAANRLSTLAEKQVPTNEIVDQIAEMYEFYDIQAPGHQAFIAYQADTKNANGYTSEAMAQMFVDGLTKYGKPLPKNVIFQEGFKKLMANYSNEQMAKDAQDKLFNNVELSEDGNIIISDSNKSLQQLMTEKLPEVATKGATKAGHVKKELVKTKVATQFIGQGSAGSSTDQYRKLYQTQAKANTGSYTADDIVFIASNGNRPNRYNPVVNNKLQGQYQNIDKAMLAGATLIMDTFDHLNKTQTYNTGEMALALYVKNNGYRRVGRSGMWKPIKSEQVSQPYIDHNVDDMIENDINNYIQTQQKTGQLSMEFGSTKSKKQTIHPGVNLIKDSGLTVEKANEFIDVLSPMITNQAYIENQAASANYMFSAGLRWARIVPGIWEQSKQGDKVRTGDLSPRPNRVKINQKESRAYGYFATDQNNNPLPSMSDLAPIMKFVEDAYGMDLSEYDAVLGNIYDSRSFIHQHRDTTESKFAENYEVVVLNLGADGGLSYDANPNSRYKNYNTSNTMPLSNGSIYAFGVGGVNRFDFHHRVESGLKSKNPLKPIKLPNGRVLKDYRITLTFRRAKDPTTQSKQQVLKSLENRGDVNNKCK